MTIDINDIMEFLSLFFNDFIGNSVLCITCLLLLSYLREVPPKFESKKMIKTIMVLAVGAFFVRFNAHYLLPYIVAEDEGHLINQALSNYALAVDFGVLSTAEIICLCIELWNALIGISSICAGAFILMGIFKAKHIMPMAIVQTIGFLLGIVFENLYKRMINAFYFYMANFRDVQVFGYKTFFYGCFMIAMIILYILSTRQKFESFWTKKINVNKHILSLIGLFFAYTLVIIIINIIIEQKDIEDNLFALFINVFLAIVLLFVPWRTFRITRGELQSDYYEVKRKEKVELYTYTQSQNKAIRKYIHDLPKHFRVLNAMAEKIGADEIVQYINELDKSLLAAKSEFSTGNAYLDELLIAELKTAQNYNASINFFGVFPNEGIKKYDITAVFMNLIDNAIEACKSVSGKREILIESKIIEDRVFITFSNPFEHKLKKSHGKFETTAKGNPKFHGYGLSSVMDVVKKEEYDGTFLTEQKDSTFIVSIDMKFAR